MNSTIHGRTHVGKVTDQLQFINNTTLVRQAQKGHASRIHTYH